MVFPPALGYFFIVDVLGGGKIMILIKNANLLSMEEVNYEICDVLIDGKYEKELSDINYPWAGSTNQRIINVPETLSQKEIILWTNYYIFQRWEYLKRIQVFLYQQKREWMLRQHIKVL